MFEAAGCGARISGVRDIDGGLTLFGGLGFELRETVGEFRAMAETTAVGRGSWDRIGGEATALRGELADFWGVVARGDRVRGGAVILGRTILRLTLGVRWLVDFPLSRESTWPARVATAGRRNATPHQMVKPHRVHM